MNKWTNDAFAGYVAAMIDGEGCIEIIGTYSVRVRIANTVRHTLQAIIDRLGYGNVREYKRPLGSTYKRLFSIEISNSVDVDRLWALCGRYIHMKREKMLESQVITKRVLNAASIIDRRNRAIMKAIERGEVQLKIAHRFGVSPQLISRIKKGHTWSSVITAHRDRALRRKYPHKMDQSIRLHNQGV